jgi:hypothetical protein
MLAGPLVGNRHGKLLAREDSFAQQDFAEPIAATAVSCGRHGLVVVEEDPG